MECPDIHKFPTNKRHRSQVRAGKIGDPGFKDTVRSDLLRLGGVTGLCLVLPPASEQPPDSLASHLASLLGVMSVLGPGDKKEAEQMDYQAVTVTRRLIICAKGEKRRLTLSSITYPKEKRLMTSFLTVVYTVSARSGPMRLVSVGSAWQKGLMRSCGLCLSPPVRGSVGRMYQKHKDSISMSISAPKLLPL